MLNDAQSKIDTFSEISLIMTTHAGAQRYDKALEPLRKCFLNKNMQKQKVQSSCTKILSLLPPSHSPFSPSNPASTPSSPVPIAPRLLSHADAQPPAGRDTHAVTPWPCRWDRPMGNVATRHGRRLHPNWASKRGEFSPWNPFLGNPPSY